AEVESFRLVSVLVEGLDKGPVGREHVGGAARYLHPRIRERWTVGQAHLDSFCGGRYEQARPLFAGPKGVLWVTSEPPAGHVKDEVSGIGNGPPRQVSDDEPEATRVLPCFGQTTTSGMSGVSQPKGQPQATRSRKAGRPGRIKRE